MKIALITTVASSIYGLRAHLISKLLEKGHSVYAITPPKIKIIKAR